MTSKKTYLFLYGVFSIFSFGCKQKSLDSEAKIVGGVEDDLIHPEVVALESLLENGKAGRCTGTIVRDDLILTAAHCVVNDMPLKSILATPYLSHGAEQALSLGKQASQYLFLPSYDPKLDYKERIPRDLAFVIFPKGTFAGRPMGQFAPEDPLLGDMVRLVGYGRTNAADPDSNPMSKRHTGTATVSLINPGIIIFATEQVGLTTVSVAQGDSGGALFNAAGQVVGVASEGTTDTGNNSISKDNQYYAVYASVNAPLANEFIRSVLATENVEGIKLGQSPVTSDDDSSIK